MELIIKPTERCNFACTFCSSSVISESKSKSDDLDLKYIFEFLERFPDTNTIIVNGGDPLMVNPDYYWQIIKWLDDRNYSTNFSFTTNLWDWWKKPEKWSELFKHSRVNVTTSFNYGETRRITIEENYSEEMFLKVVRKFEKDIGYLPDFISVINYDNISKAIDNVRLAKFLGVECKLNYAVASGEQSEPFTVGEMYKIYAEIYDLGLADWEYNTKQMTARLKDKPTSCPLNRKCDEGIRSLQPFKDGKNYYSCGAFGDDGEYSIDFDKEMKSDKVATPLQDDVNLSYLKVECLTCPAFEICNGCYKTVKDLKTHNMVEKSCKAMKQAITVVLGTELVDTKINEERFYVRN